MKKEKAKPVSSVREFASRKEWEYYVWEKITESLAEAVNSKRVEKSLNLLLTASERKQVINRAAAISMLKRGKTYKEIGEALWLSPTTISAIRKSMRTGEEYVSDYKWNKVGKSSNKSDKQDGLKLKISLLLDALFEVPPPPRQGRRIPGGERVIQPHGKLVYPKRLR